MPFLMHYGDPVQNWIVQINFGLKRKIWC